VAPETLVADSNDSDYRGIRPPVHFCGWFTAGAIYIYTFLAEFKYLSS
jgi:hypothetical protein